MTENLLSSSSILLFGRHMKDIKINQRRAPNPFGNKLLDEQYRKKGARFARIYAVSFGGSFRELDPPVILLVHGRGELAQSRVNMGALAKNDPRVSVAPEAVGKTGTVGQTHQFSEDIHVWTYDKADFSMRMDISTGMLEDILIYAEFSGEMDYTSVGGGKVGGGKVGGGKVGGGKVGGGKVGGG